MKDYDYVTPATGSRDPKMIRALDGWLGQYETCYVLAGLRAAEEEEPCGIPSAKRPRPEHVLKALPVVRKIVDHCGLGRDPPTMASEPTRNDLEAEFEEVKVVPIDEFLASL